MNALNPAQREAVEYTDGPSLVIAGAGSGKTRVLTYKIAYLLQQGMRPWNILALTFTNKAADEMKTRIISQVGEDAARGLWMGTFHSIFARILRMEHQTIGFSSDFTIYDTADSKSLLRSIIREMGLDDKTYKAGTVLSHISAAKNRLIMPAQYQADAQLVKADQSARIPETGHIYANYWARCRQAGAMDFDDLLLYTYLLFAHKPEVLARYEQHFQFVLVDEYQDTNFAQHAIVWQLTQHHRHVCVVGDDAQSIYSFRGANIDNILTFQRLYQGAKLFKLEQNYRSTQTIVGAANSLIKHNRGQIPKEVFSEKEKGQPIHVYGFFSDIEEASGVGRKVLNLNRYEHIPWNDIAILYRTNAQSRSFEEAFRKLDIPYRIFGGLSFYQRKEIKDTIAYFRLAVNPNDEEAFKRVINYPARGIGQTTLNKIIGQAATAGVSLWQIITNPALYHLDVNRGTWSKLESFAMLISSFREQVDKTDAATLGQQIIKEAGISADIFRGREPEDISRQENLQELIDGLQQFVDDRQEEEGQENVFMTNYLQEVSLISDLDESDDDSEEKISLMTVHSAKGLEFRVVFVVGMEQDLFPNQMAASSLREMEEERRLFYVAITRAKEQCFLTHADNRYRFGKSEFCTPSSFLNDIDPQFLTVEQSSQSAPHRGSLSHSKSSWKDNASSWNTATYSKPTNASDPSSATPSANRFSNGPTSSPGMRPVGRRPVIADSETSDTPAAQPATSSVQTTFGTLSVGQRIEHARFGRGEIIALAGSGIDAKATVRFENVGTKQLLLRFAKFTILS
ncbi:MAG: exodeoxyribonuclease V subunit gamma [Bacteroidales bacterium]|nr:exodeoxyribonuclease V subunit gamma [Bacteroidales bacterium]